jgi:hypothetical protein
MTAVPSNAEIKTKVKTQTKNKIKIVKQKQLQEKIRSNMLKNIKRRKASDINNQKNESK